MRKPISIRAEDGTVWRDGELIGRINAPLAETEHVGTFWNVEFTSGHQGRARITGKMRDYRGEVWFSASA